jgi:hypothetical protein
MGSVSQGTYGAPFHMSVVYDFVCEELEVKSASSKWT